MDIDRDTLLTAIRKAVQAGGGRCISINDFLKKTEFRQGHVFRHFPRWSDALRAAGFHFAPHNKPIAPDLLLTDWGSVAAKLRHIPTCAEYRVHGKYEYTTLQRRFGSWNHVIGAFQAFAAKKPRWKKLLARLPALPSSIPRGTQPSRTTRTIKNHIRKMRPRKPAARLAHRPACGIPIDFGSLRHAPTNEFGVIFLFGILAGQLGFMIEGFQAAFPDCLAKRLIGAATWQQVTIEFEFESKNFHTHHHPIDGCDIIVCWEHNWTDCPAGLEVISLSEEIKRPSSS